MTALYNFERALTDSFLAYEDKRLSKKLKCPARETAYVSPYLDTLKSRLNKNLVKSDLKNWGITLDEWRMVMQKVIDRFDPDTN